MTRRLRAMVLGAGFAGQGHVRALRDCGVEIVAISGRTEHVVREVAESLHIPLSTDDWRRTLRKVRPDIVAVATPGGSHVEMILEALELGCHIFADKPLATTAEDAERLYGRAVEAGVKTAYAASYRYQPNVIFARELVNKGEIGRLLEMEFISHYHWPELTSFGWPHRLDTGGGRLNNNFSHKLAIALAITGGTVLAATGDTRNDLLRAPVGPCSHDFRRFTQAALTSVEAAKCEWRDVDSDWAYTVLARLGTESAGVSSAVSATFRHSALRLGRATDYVACYGENGTIHIDGAYAQGALYIGRDKTNWRRRRVPARILKSLPAIADDTERNWTQLAREFVADIRGEGDRNYLKFRDGWLFQRVIDAVRVKEGWAIFRHAIPDP